MMAKIKIQTIGNIIYITLSETMIGNEEHFRLQEVISKSIDDGVNNIIIDTSKLRRTNSTGLGIIVSLYTKVKQSGGDLVMVVKEPRIRNILKVTTLDTLFNVYDNLDDAKHYFE
jgi:anti-sigma B factor antagonist